MNQRMAWRLAGLAAVLLAAAGVARAAVQGRDTVCWLGTGNWQLREKAGDVFLAPARWDRSDRMPDKQRSRWYLSAPTIRSESGRFLAADPEGRAANVRLAREKGPHTRWAFEFVSQLRPGAAKDERHLKEGPAGFTFRVKVAEGPLRDWYLAAEGPAAGPEGGRGLGPAVRRLRLVPDVRKATVFTYIETNYFVDHK